MDRRSVIKLAAAASALPAAQAITSLEEAGSSVAPIGNAHALRNTIGTTSCSPGYMWSRDRNRCVLKERIGDWPAGALQQRNYQNYLIASGQAQLPASTQLIGVGASANEATLNAHLALMANTQQVTPGQYISVDTLKSGLFYTGQVDLVLAPLNMAFKAGLSLLTVAAWIGWNIGTYMYLEGPQVQRNIQGFVYGGGWMGLVGGTQGSIGGQVIGAGYVNGMLIVVKQ